MRLCLPAKAFSRDAVVKSYRRRIPQMCGPFDRGGSVGCNGAQIEDIVTRKAEVNAANVVITPIHESTNTSESGD
ncbi:MAG: hypothetical protein ACLTS1_08975 [Coprococcus sp.]